jgi:hypothetical protein
LVGESRSSSCRFDVYPERCETRIENSWLISGDPVVLIGMPSCLKCGEYVYQPFDEGLPPEPCDNPKCPTNDDGFQRMVEEVYGKDDGQIQLRKILQEQADDDERKRLKHLDKKVAQQR